MSIGKGKQEKRCGNAENNGKNIERLMYGFIEFFKRNKSVWLQEDKKNKTAQESSWYGEPECGEEKIGTGNGGNNAYKEIKW